MGNKNPKATSSTTNPEEENVVAPQPHQQPQQPQSPLLLPKPQPHQPLGPTPPPSFQKMPLLYPSYKREDYEKMSEERIDKLFATYGIMTLPGDLAYKRKLAIETFRWDHINDQSKT